MTSPLSRAAKTAELVLTVLSAGLLATIMIVIFGDVVGRRFGMPIPISYEVTQIAMGLMVYSGLPLVIARREQVSIDLLTNVMPRGVEKILRAVFDAVGVLVGAVWAWQLYVQATKLDRYNTKFMFLQYEVAPVVEIMAVGCALGVVAYLALFISSISAIVTVEGRR